MLEQYFPVYRAVYWAYLPKFVTCRGDKFASKLLHELSKRKDMFEFPFNFNFFVSQPLLYEMSEPLKWSFQLEGFGLKNTLSFWKDGRL